jgi:hypothetical protein
MTIFAEPLNWSSEDTPAPLHKFLIQAYSTLNGGIVSSPIHLNDPKDGSFSKSDEQWAVHYSISEDTHTQPEPMLRDEYKMLRHRIYLLETSLLKYEPESEVVLDDVVGEDVTPSTSAPKPKPKTKKKGSNKLLNHIKRHFFDAPASKAHN